VINQETLETTVKNNPTEPHTRKLPFPRKTLEIIAE